jgi:hypothetical protein
VNDCVGDEVAKAAASAKPGDVSRRGPAPGAGARGRRQSGGRCPLSLAGRRRRAFPPPSRQLPAAFHASQVLLLENVRFYKEEEKNDPEFAKKVGAWGCACAWGRVCCVWLWVWVCWCVCV